MKLIKIKIEKAKIKAGYKKFVTFWRKVARSIITFIGGVIVGAVLVYLWTQKEFIFPNIYAQNYL